MLERMGWFEDLQRSVGQAVGQSGAGLKRFAGRALKSLDSPFARPMIGLKPELGGAVLSAVLPEESTPKKLLDTALYLASGPLTMTASLAGSTPQSDDPYGNWQRLGYKSREDMVSRIEKQKAFDEALARRAPYTYIADDYGPPRPVKYPNGTIYVGDYRVDRFNPTVVEAETGSIQPARSAVPPAATRPREESRPPVTRPVSPEVTQAPSQQTRQALENEMLARAADQERTAGLMRRMIELDVTGGMSANAMRDWVSSNPDLAQRLITDRLGRKERLAKEFAGFSEYAQ